MPRIQVTDRQGLSFVLDSRAGEPLMHGLHERGAVEAICGGSCACATCHVHIDPAWFEQVGPAGPDEMALLEYSLERRPTSRLSCQVQVEDRLDGLRLHVAASEG